MTLEELKQRPLNKDYYQRLKDRWIFDEHNIKCYRSGMTNKQGIEWSIWGITHDGNEPFSNEEMLDNARCFIEECVYTDKEWKKYFIPAINEMIIYNNTFERWYPGYLIKNSEGKLAIVEHDYALAFGGRNFTDLAICELDENEEIDFTWAWAHYDDYCLVSKEPNKVSKNLKKIQKHNSTRGGAPINMNADLAKSLGFTSIHTYASAKASGWDITEGAIKL